MATIHANSSIDSKCLVYVPPCPQVSGVHSNWTYPDDFGIHSAHKRLRPRRKAGKRSWRFLAKAGDFFSCLQQRGEIGVCTLPTLKQSDVDGTAAGGVSGHGAGAGEAE